MGSMADMAMMRRAMELLFLLFSSLVLLGLTVAGQETFQVVHHHEPPTPGTIQAYLLTDPPPPSAYAVSVAETDLTLVSTSTGLAESWLRTYALPRLPFTNITSVLVGKGVLCHAGREHHWGLVLASALNLHYSLLKSGVGSRVRVAVPFSSACFEHLRDSSLVFRRDVFDEALKPLLGFLRDSHSLYSIDHAPISPEPAELGAVVAHHHRALGKAGFSQLHIIRLEEAVEDPNARRRLTMSSSVSSSPYHEKKPKHVSAPSPSITLPTSPLSPPSSNFAPAPGTPFSFVPVSSPSEVPVNPPNNPIPAPFGVPAPPCVMAPAFAPAPAASAAGVHRVDGLWCVAKPTVPTDTLQEAIDYACGEGGADCDEIKPNGSCFNPDNAVAHASYAFNSYWQKTKRSGGSCGFGGTAILIASDPSFDQCRFELS